MRSGQRATLCSLLSSYYFLFANVRHGLLHHLLEVYTSAGETAALETQAPARYRIEIVASMDEDPPEC